MLRQRSAAEIIVPTTARMMNPMTTALKHSDVRRIGRMPRPVGARPALLGGPNLTSLIAATVEKKADGFN